MALYFTNPPRDLFFAFSDALAIYIKQIAYIIQFTRTIYHFVKACFNFTNKIE